MRAASRGRRPSGRGRPCVVIGGNVVGVDPHKRTLSATVVDPRGGIVASEHFRVSGVGHRALEAWALQFGAVVRWGVEGASGWGRHTAAFLTGRGCDVRDVCANRTPRADRGRQRGKSDTLDSERIARETLADPLLPKAFKRAGPDQGPDEQHQLLVLWHGRRRSILTSRQHLVCEAENLLCALPLELQAQLPDSKAVRPRLRALARRNRRRRYDPPTTLRLQLLDGYRAQIQALDREEKDLVAKLHALVKASGSTLGELCGLDTRSVAELFSRGGRRAPLHRGRIRALQRISPAARLDRRGARRADPSPLQPRRQPPDQRRAAPDGGHAAALRAARAGDLRPCTRRRAYQEGGAAGPQAPPLRRHLPAYAPRPRRTRRAPPPRCMTARGPSAVKGGPTGPSASEPCSGALDGAWPRATLPRGGGRLT
jgi:hypothetical protein